MPTGMGEGRGNLRENREDPAPTVGLLLGVWHGMPMGIIFVHVRDAIARVSPTHPFVPVGLKGNYQWGTA